MIDKLESSLFTFELWNAGCYLDLGLLNSHFDILTVNGRKLIKQYAIGYCPADAIPVRPKFNYTAVMYFKDDVHFWSHLTNEEFNIIFKDD